MFVQQIKMTSVSSRSGEVQSSVELDFEESHHDHEDPDTTAWRRSPGEELPLRGSRPIEVEVYQGIPDDDVDRRRRRVSLKLDVEMKSSSTEEVEGEEAEVRPEPPTEPDATQPLETDKPLSSGWAAALAAASAAGSVRAAAKRRTNAGRANTFVPPPTRSLFCLSLTNPLRKLTVSVVEWKYPFCNSSLAVSM